MGEHEATAFRVLYGLDDPMTENFGRQCLTARRLCEAGVRFVQCTHSYKWDQHANLKADHEKNAREVDKPIAALLADLSARGLLEDTLVLWAGEFGRTPTPPPAATSASPTSKDESCANCSRSAQRRAAGARAPVLG